MTIGDKHRSSLLETRYGVFMTTPALYIYNISFCTFYSTDRRRGDQNRRLWSRCKHPLPPATCILSADSISVYGCISASTPYDANTEGFIDHLSNRLTQIPRVFCNPQSKVHIKSSHYSCMSLIFRDIDCLELRCDSYIFAALILIPLILEVHIHGNNIRSSTYWS